MNKPNILPTLYKTLIWIGLSLLIINLVLLKVVPLKFEKSFAIFYTSIIIVYLGFGLQYYTFWKTGQYEKIQQLGFRFLLMSAGVGVLFILSVLLKW